MDRARNYNRNASGLLQMIARPIAARVQKVCMNVGGSIRISNGIRLKYARLQRVSSRLQRLYNLSDNKYCSRIPRVFFRNVSARILACARRCRLLAFMPSQRDVEKEYVN